MQQIPPEYVAVDFRSNVYSANAQRKGIEESIDDRLDLRTTIGTTVTIRKVVRVVGNIYAVGDY